MATTTNVVGERGGYGVAFCQGSGAEPLAASASPLANKARTWRVEVRSSEPRSESSEAPAVDFDGGGPRDVAGIVATLARRWKVDIDRPPFEGPDPAPSGSADWPLVVVVREQITLSEGDTDLGLALPADQWLAALPARPANPDAALPPRLVDVVGRLRAARAVVSIDPARTREHDGVPLIEVLDAPRAMWPELRAHGFAALAPSGGQACCWQLRAWWRGYTPDRNPVPGMDATLQSGSDRYAVRITRVMTSGAFCFKQGRGDDEEQRAILRDDGRWWHKYGRRKHHASRVTVGRGVDYLDPSR